MSLRLAHAWSVALAMLGLLGHSAAYAAISVAPARFDEALRIFTSTPLDGLSGADILKPESVPVSFTSVNGTTFNGTATTTAKPVIQANLAQAGGDGNFTGGAGIIYQFAYEGPATSALPVFILTSGAVSVTGASASASVSIQVGTLAFASPVLFRQASASTSSGTLSDSFTVGIAGGPFLLQANAVYQVVMNANLSVADAASGPGTTASAFLDPTFIVDPSFANAGLYSFVQSAGITPIPEPSKVVLLCAGSLLLAAARHRRRSSTQRSASARA